MQEVKNVEPTSPEKNVRDIKDLAPDLLKQMQDYAANLHKRHPTMKPERVKKLTAKKFNIELI